MYIPIPYKEYMVSVSKIHTVYVAEYGNPKGAPILVFHGGPGYASKSSNALQYDLEKYRVILFDQRGGGKSQPYGELTENTTNHLVTDAETIRKHLKIGSWFLSGTSWGSTLALLYAETYPDRVRGLLLSAIFLADRGGDAWAFGDTAGVARLFPDGWDELRGQLSAIGMSSGTTIRDLYSSFVSGDDKKKLQIASIIGNWEVNLLSRNIPIRYRRPEEIAVQELSMIGIFLHYQANHYFLEDTQIMTNISTIEDIPACIVHGRYDILCPLEAAWELHKKLPHSEFVPLPESHHTFSGDGSVARAYIFRSFLAKYAN